MSTYVREDQSETHTLDIQFEFDLPKGKFRADEGMELDWQDIEAHIWCQIRLLDRIIWLDDQFALSMKVEQHVNDDGQATGMTEVLSAEVTAERATLPLIVDQHMLVLDLLGDPCVTEAIWKAAENKHYFE